MHKLTAIFFVGLIATVIVAVTLIHLGDAQSVVAHKVASRAGHV